MRLEPFPALRVRSFSPLGDFRLFLKNNSQKEERGICVCAFIIKMLKGPSRVRRALLLCSSGQRPAAPLSPSPPARAGRIALTPLHRRACTAWLPRFLACTVWWPRTSPESPSLNGPAPTEGVQNVQTPGGVLVTAQDSPQTPYQCAAPPTPTLRSLRVKTWLQKQKLL